MVANDLSSEVSVTPIPSHASPNCIQLSRFFKDSRPFEAAQAAHGFPDI